MKKLACVSIVVLLLAACVAPSTMLINDQGHVLRCSATGFGWIGAPLAEHAEGNCVRDYEELGYVELPHVFLGLRLDFTKSPPSILEVEHSSPAERAGLMVGDIIVQIDGAKIDAGQGAFLGFYGVLKQKEPGERIAILINRKGQQISVLAVLTGRGPIEKPPNPAPTDRPRV